MKKILCTLCLAVVVCMAIVSCKADSDEPISEPISLSQKSFTVTIENEYKDNVVNVLIIQKRILSFMDDTHAVLRLVDETVDEDTDQKLSSSMLDQEGTYILNGNTVVFNIKKVKWISDSGKPEESVANIFASYTYDSSSKTIVGEDHMVMNQITYIPF